MLKMNSIKTKKFGFYNDLNLFLYIYHSILTYDILFIIIAIYYQTKISINFLCRQKFKSQISYSTTIEFTD